MREVDDSDSEIELAETPRRWRTSTVDKLKELNLGS